MSGKPLALPAMLATIILTSRDPRLLPRAQGPAGCRDSCGLIGPDGRAPRSGWSTTAPLQVSSYMCLQPDGSGHRAATPSSVRPWTRAYSRPAMPIPTPRKKRSRVYRAETDAQVFTLKTALDERIQQAPAKLNRTVVFWTRFRDREK